MCNGDHAKAHFNPSDAAGPQRLLQTLDFELLANTSAELLRRSTVDASKLYAACCPPTRFFFESRSRLGLVQGSETEDDIPRKDGRRS